jgi:hypothetical protein
MWPSSQISGTNHGLTLPLPEYSRLGTLAEDLMVVKAVFPFSETITTLGMISLVAALTL